MTQPADPPATPDYAKIIAKYDATLKRMQENSEWRTVIVGLPIIRKLLNAEDVMLETFHINLIPDDVLFNARPARAEESQAALYSDQIAFLFFKNPKIPFEQFSDLAIARKRLVEAEQYQDCFLFIRSDAAASTPASTGAKG